MAQVHADHERLNELSGRIIGCAFTVLNTLGAGFLEKVYENALALELRKVGLVAEQQRGVQVMYDDSVVGEYFTDLLVEDEIVVELKAIKALDEAHRAQCVNYLKATDLRLGLVLNFGTSRLEIKRVANRL
jgi:GxxExxY protein